VGARVVEVVGRAVGVRVVSSLEAEYSCDSLDAEYDCDCDACWYMRVNWMRSGRRLLPWYATRCV